MPGNAFLRCLAIVLAVHALGIDAKAQVFVGYREAGIVNSYDANSGALITERFVHGLSEPVAICVDGGVLFVLQNSGVVGKYDAQTGAVINDHFISSLRMPQAMAVRDGAVYITSLAWPFQQNLGPGNGNLIGKYDESTGACIKAAIMQTDHLAGSIAVAGSDLFVTGGASLNANGPAVFDTRTGAPIHRDYQPMLNGADFVTAADDWIWFTAGHASQYGMIFKYSATGDANGVPRSMIGYFQPLAKNLNAPTVIAVSGEELFVACGSGTAIAKYNATTGEQIKAGFIPDRSDKLGGLAVTPRAASGQYALADARYAAHNAMLDWLFWASVNGSVLYGVSGLLFVLVAVGLLLVYFYKPPESAPEARTGTPAEPISEAAPAEPAPEPVAEPAYYVEIAHLRKPPPAPQPSFWGMALLVLFIGMGVVAGGLAWFARTTGGIVVIGPGANHTPDMIGMWDIDPNEGADHNPPIYYDVDIYPTHLDYYGNTARTKLEGHWRDDGFWYTKPDGSGEVEVCHLNDPLNLNLHLSTFNSGEQGDVVLYKRRGTDDEMKAMRDKYPQAVTYPPPAGVIKYWMSKYELDNLPWHADREEVNDSEPDVARGHTYVYHSDNPQVPELRVTLKNHRVVKIEGGNG